MKNKPDSQNVPHSNGLVKTVAPIDKVLLMGQDASLGFILADEDRQHQLQALTEEFLSDEGEGQERTAIAANPLSTPPNPPSGGEPSEREGHVPALSPYTPSISRRSIEQLSADMMSIAKRLDDPKTIILYANDVEVGDSQLIASVLRGHVVFDHAAGEWHFWNNLHWQADPGANIAHVASDVAAYLYRQAYIHFSTEAAKLKGAAGANPTAAQEKGIIEADAQRDTCFKRMVAVRRASTIKHVLDLASATMLLGITGKEWDTQAHLLGVDNGVVDLLTGQPVQPSPEQYIRTVAPVPFVAGATCPLFEKALLEIFDGDKAKAAFVQRSLGYAMTGECTESYFNIWYGKHGRNAKEFILELSKDALGDKLAGIIEAELLLKAKHNHAANGATEALMVLRGRRVAWASETEEGRTLSTANMKQLSGGHSITGRHNFQGQVQWRRTHTLFFLTNFLPHVPSQELAEWDRIRVLTFPLSFVDDPDPNEPYQRKKDKTLGERIRATELSGILNWLIAGALEWRKSGLGIPSSVTADTKAYKADEDTLGRFFKECCEIEENPKAIAKATSKLAVRTTALYSEYKLWFENGNNGRPLGRNTFLDKVKGRGFPVEDRRSAGTQSEHFIGIGVKVVG
jgi:putative DNA primase/helicase